MRSTAEEPSTVMVALAVGVDGMVAATPSAEEPVPHPAAPTTTPAPATTVASAARILVTELLAQEVARAGCICPDDVRAASDLRFVRVTLVVPEQAVAEGLTSVGGRHQVRGVVGDVPDAQQMGGLVSHDRITVGRTPVSERRVLLNSRRERVRAALVCDPDDVSVAPGSGLPLSHHHKVLRVRSVPPGVLHVRLELVQPRAARAVVHAEAVPGRRCAST